ncbi:chorion peroxidase-like [Littorina saxatilis]|uniref:Peroxidase n=1 Tax=Littorina saxatilis TaxID=31220 RepID=A0AAN9BNV4_9CAEN
MGHRAASLTTWLWSWLLISLAVLLKTLSAQHSFSDDFFSAYIEPLYDELGFEVSEDHLLEMTDMKSTSLGVGIGLNYSFTVVPRPPEVPPPLLPQSLTPTGLRGNPYHSTGSGLETLSSLALHRFKRQANGFHGANSIGDHVFQDAGRGSFMRDPVSGFNPATAGFNALNSGFNSGASFGQFPTVTFGGDGTSAKSCGRTKPMRCNPRAPYRTIDGSCNNLAHPTWGAINQPMKRLLPAVYFDGYDVPRLTSRSDPRRLLPSPRLVSRNIHEPSDIKGHNLPELTNLLQVWGQFLDHDLTGTPAHKGPDGRDLKCCDGVFLTENQQIHRDAFNGGRCNPIYIPPMDRHFTYSCMNFARSIAAKRPQDCDKNAPKQIRQQTSMLTAWIDASQVYGSKTQKAGELRTYRKGTLIVTSDNLLPEDTNSTCVKEEPGDYCFLAGEKRVNEHTGLMALHIVFLRYHNRMAEELSRINPGWSDERIYQEVRRVMGAIMQHVTYHDWLPPVLGPSIMRQYSLNVVSPGTFGPSYWTYDSKLDPTILNVFATAAFRFGHTMIPSLFTMGDRQVRLHTMFNRPKFILQNRREGLKNMCAGMIHDPVHHSDRFMVSDLSDRLFEDKNNVSLDLASLNIQRARDHGLPPYNDYRKVCGLPVYETFEDMYQSEPERAEVFRRVYEDVDDIDVFAGGLSEKPMAGAVVGPTFACLLARQFHSLKFADRFWYETQQAPGAFTAEQLGEIRKVTLSKIMCMTASMHTVTVNPMYKSGAFMPRGVVMPNGVYVTQNRFVPCDDLPDTDLSLWYDPAAQV